MDLNQGLFAGKKVLILGGCGFLGTNLTRRLLELGANITLFTKINENKENLKEVTDEITFIEGNLTNDSDIVDAIKGKDYIFHLAWQTDLKKSMANPKQDLFNDCLGLITLLESCKNNNPHVKIIFTSTVTVVGLVEKLPSDESILPNPESVYDIHKLFAEYYLKLYYNQYKLKSVVLRLSNVFGEYQKIDNPNRGVLNFMIGKALRNEPMTVYGTGNFIRDYCYVQNYIDAFILAALSEKTNGEVYNLGTGEGRTFNEVVEKIKLITEPLTNKPVTITHIAFPEGEHSLNKRNFITDCSKFKEATGWFPKISFDEGLKRTIEFYINRELKYND